MISCDQPITDTKKPQSCLLEFMLLENGHLHSCMLLVVSLLPINYFSEIFVGIMLYDRHVCRPHAGELK